jgi:hypothetical protein
MPADLQAERIYEVLTRARQCQYVKDTRPTPAREQLAHADVHLDSRVEYVPFGGSRRGLVCEDTRCLEHNG